jgi:hypothetical protein
MTVDNISSTGTEDIYDVTYNSGSYGNLQQGMTVVRTSGGSLLLDASSNNSPYLDVINDNSINVRVGNLSGITSTNFGTLSNYGF